MPYSSPHANDRRQGVFARLTPVYVAIAMVVLYYAVAGRSTPPQGWGSDYAAAMGAASETQRNVVVAFYSKGCPPCAAMDRNVLGSEAVRSELAGFVPVRVDAFQERELANQFDVQGTPTYAVVDPQGRLLARCEGYQPVERFVAFLRQALVLQGDIPSAQPPSNAP